MAITATPTSSTLIIIVDNGTWGTDNLRYANVKVAATDADVYDVAVGAAGLSTLQSKAFMLLQRSNVVELENVG
ncbi:MAG: DUF1659 domain-containing protein [Syntrophomonas sp.]